MIPAPRTFLRGLFDRATPDRNDAHSFFGRLGDRVVTGPHTE